MRLWTSAGLVAALFTGAATAEPVTTSIRPVIRPIAAPQAVKLTAAPVPSSLRPAARPSTPVEASVTADSSAFQSWFAGFRKRAQAAGIRADVIDWAFDGVTADPKVVKHDQNQSEFVKPIWDYLDSAVSESRISNGRKAAEDNRALMDRIEARYGVDRQVVLAIWGMETAYGSFRGYDNTIRSLATLAQEPRRGSFFEEQLIDALRIIQEGDITPQEMKGSWAGAMGHTQFMPTSFRAYAVDFDGDGRRDIWSDDPTDALASTAAYLKHFDWTKGQPWGVEVRLPRGFDFTLANRKVKKSANEWGALGVTDMDGRKVADHGPASILLPAGGQGVAFMIFGNFSVIERYNAADAYVIAVGHLGDRITGGGPIRGSWPVDDRTLSFTERKELQERLTRRGFDTQHVDGRIGPVTIGAVRAYQIVEGLMPDGYPSIKLLERLR